MQLHERKSIDKYRWQPLVAFLPVALTISAAVFYLGWWVWTNQFLMSPRPLLLFPF